MKHLAILGSTGSIGTQALELVRLYPERFRVVALAAGHNGEALLDQIREFKPLVASLDDEKAYAAIRDRVPEGTVLLCGREGLEAAASVKEADMDLVAVVGIAGLPAVMAGLKAKKQIALANKEALVTGGKLVTAAAKANGCSLFPVDSEHSAIFQCLQGRADNAISSILLTCSGGPFRTWSKEQIARVTPEDALKHPTWNMGKKITIDCATLMNKGLEIIEACWLFDVPQEKVRPVIHPESVVHSAVEFCDGAFIAQMGEPDMKLPILYAFAYPERLFCGAKRLDLTAHGALTFSEPDTERFPCLALAREAIKLGGNIPAALNAAGEEAVGQFLAHKIG
ncbi:MAG: 1-deoxy-D-xylulose-5-phosphate reductoisomerase, partial [Clostridia bacterium]|nr:1-deoxy-D-xylulose-5-phosphate reductoisomerase [Clostridia bacterium]